MRETAAARDSGLSDILFKLVLMALAFAVAVLLLRAGLAVAAHVPRDPNEGWNAYLAEAAMRGAPLYPQAHDPHALMIDNYPPLSFFLVGALSHVTGDAIVAGRLVSLAAFLAVTGAIVALLRAFGANVLAALFGGLFFASGLLIESDYVAMNDPQLLGHALQIAGASLLFEKRPKILAAALLLAAGLFVKHNLIALPLAASLWLLARDRTAGLTLMGAGLVFGLAGLAATRLLLGVDLPAALASPRVWRLANFRHGAAAFLSWAGIALLVQAWFCRRAPGDQAARFTALYLAFALLSGGLFAFGDGVDANIFFDAAIALALGCGLALARLPRPGILALAAAAPLALALTRHAADIDAAYGEAFARQSQSDIAFLKAHPGPALCEDLSLCYWADKSEPVDMFNLSQALKTGARDKADLARLFARRHFGSIALSSLTPFAFGPDLKAALLSRYRVDHADDNGVFLEAR